MHVPALAAFGLLEQQGSYFLVANWRVMAGHRVLCWDIPGGGVEPGESLPAACRRELVEETGFEVEVQDLAFVIERFGFRSRGAQEACHYFFFQVRAVSETSILRDPKIIEAGFKTPSEIAQLCTQPYHAELHAWLAGGCQQSYFFDPGSGP